MNNRRNFLKNIAMAAIASALPTPKPEKLTIKPDGYAGIGTGGTERLRITSAGNIGIRTTIDNGMKLKGLDT